MKSEIFTVVFLLIGFSCCHPKVDYELWQPEYQNLFTQTSTWGFYQEDDLDECHVPYLCDNITFKPCKGIIYEIKYLIDGDEYVYERSPDLGEFFEWSLKLKSDSSLSNNRVVSHLVTACIDSSVVKRIPRDLYYTQTSIMHIYLNPDSKRLFNENTGVVENIKNIWMHPPRFGLFKKAFISPWPFVTFPLRIGPLSHSWHAKWANDYMGDEQLVQWKDLAAFEYDYEITDRKILETPVGSVECWIINGTGTCQYGETKSEFAFNPDLGFISMEFSGFSPGVLSLEMIDFFDDCERINELSEF